MGTVSKIEVVRADAERLLHDGRDAATDLVSELEARVRKNPISMVLAGFGIGYLLGALRLPIARIASLGMRHALVPMLGLVLDGRLGRSATAAGAARASATATS